MSNLTAIFGNVPDKPADSSDKLRELYWNRAELKKELARVRDETYKLRECIADKEGTSAKLRQELEQLESMLLDPGAAHSVIVYYQFRRLNLSCKSKIADFAEHLKQQRERRLRGDLLSEWNDHRSHEVSAIEARIGEQRVEVQMLEDQLQSERHKLRSTNGLLRFFRKRAMTRAVDGIMAAMELSQQQESELLQQFDAVQKRTPPEDQQGLDLATKRLINFMILSYAQQLYLHFSVDGLAAMSQEAGTKSAGAISYGSKSDCDDMLAKIARGTEAHEKLTDFADVLQRRAKLIAEKAMFRSDDDAVPTAGSVVSLYAITKDGAVQEAEANLLGENYWDIAKVLSR